MLSMIIVTVPSHTHVWSWCWWVKLVLVRRHYWMNSEKKVARDPSYHRYQRYVRYSTWNYHFAISISDYCTESSIIVPCLIIIPSPNSKNKMSEIHKIFDNNPIPNFEWQHASLRLQCTQQLKHLKFVIWLVTSPKYWWIEWMTCLNKSLLKPLNSHHHKKHHFPPLFWCKIVYSYQVFVIFVWSCILKNLPRGGPHRITVIFTERCFPV